MNGIPTQAGVYSIKDEVRSAAHNRSHGTHAQPTLVEIRSPVKIFGDIHGQVGSVTRGSGRSPLRVQLTDLLDIFAVHGSPDAHTVRAAVHIASGRDLVDRATFSCARTSSTATLWTADPTASRCWRSCFPSRCCTPSQ